MTEKDAPAEIYGRYLKEGKLGFQRCTDCSSAVFYPRVLCPFCGGASLKWSESSGRGTVYATTAVYRRDTEPYNVALVDLEEGFRMMSRIEGLSAEEVEIGMKATFATRGRRTGRGLRAGGSFMSLRGRAVIVGVAESDLGEVGPGYTPLDLIGQATTRALDDAGLKKEEVDGFFSASAYYHMPTLSVGEYLGIRPRYSDATNMGGSSCQQPDVNVALTHGNGGVFSSQVTAILGSEETL